MTGLKQRHASGAFDLGRLGGAAPTAFGGSPEVFLAKRSKPFLTIIGQTEWAVQAEVPMTAPREGALLPISGIRRPTSPLLLALNTSGEPSRAGAAPPTTHA